MTTAEHQMKSLLLIAEKALRERGAANVSSIGRLICSGLNLDVGPEGVATLPAGLKLTPLHLFGGNLYLFESGTAVAFALKTSTSALGIYFENFSKGKGLEWFQWEPAV